MKMSWQSRRGPNQQTVRGRLDPILLCQGGGRKSTSTEIYLKWRYIDICNFIPVKILLLHSFADFPTFYLRSVFLVTRQRVEKVVLDLTTIHFSVEGRKMSWSKVLSLMSFLISLTRGKVAFSKVVSCVWNWGKICLSPSCFLSESLKVKT